MELYLEIMKWVLIGLGVLLIAVLVVLFNIEARLFAHKFAASAITLAEIQEMENARRKELANDWIKYNMPIPFRWFITRKTINNIVQTHFKEIKEYIEVET